MFEVGQRVWDVIRGEGVVVRIEANRDFPVRVEIEGVAFTYTISGKTSRNHKIPSLYPYPVEVVKKLVKPSINWEHVRDDYKFLAQDANGNAWLYWEKPMLGDGCWITTRGECSEADSYASYTSGAVDWKDSLIARTKEV